ncbi:MAG: 1-acyl-sn-glycerol-3-phosphate acyltransferase [Rhodoplanes sp.]|uniref:lysophospholipid acyltransferase family protein n=1 Tax=Rhodoplanes sp. TaxID=1968906 RepID=UPI0018236768|nr:lysophospholipid acyltransferase family protein [Rhodoplanes sp.]NVO13465.1 1-acyl-sn-glycerol-3-phosphate acyltransferase [Rhodoplanes sp.]
MSLYADPPSWELATPGEVLRWPLPYQGFANRALLRAVALAARGRVLGVTGLQNIRPGYDPFILALNHSTRIEALLVPAVLTLHRGGRLIHFMADWNFQLIPGIGLLYRRAEILAVTAKPARPRVLDVLRPLYRPAGSVLDHARDCLARGRSVGVFVEGTVNRDPNTLLPGRRSAALLSLETGVPVVPVGIRFPHAPPGRPISDRDAIEVRIGPPLLPRERIERPSATALRSWHGAVMAEIARLSGKRSAGPICSDRMSTPAAPPPLHGGSP